MVPASGGGSEWFPRSEEEQMVPANGGKEGLGAEDERFARHSSLFPIRYSLPEQACDWENIPP